MLRGGRKHGARAVGSGRSNGAHCIAIDRQSLDVERTTTYALIGFISATDAKFYCITHNFVGIEEPSGIATENGHQISQID